MSEPMDLHPCARCARVQKTCCQRTEILVTEGDRRRIAAFVGREDFWERRAVRDASYLEDDPDDPDWRRATVLMDVAGRTGTRAMLKKRANEDCTFLGAAGCVLPEATRPLVCRLYPFEYTHRGIVGEASEYCPTALVDPDGVGMARVLAMDPGAAERWRAQLYAELGIADAARADDLGRPDRLDQLGASGAFGTITG
ncbi:MAG: YkgJ family cysteine cluster protein [Planctomycetota bacterium]